MRQGLAQTACGPSNGFCQADHTEEGKVDWGLISLQFLEAWPNSILQGDGRQSKSMPPRRYFFAAKDTLDPTQDQAFLNAIHDVFKETCMYIYIYVQLLFGRFGSAPAMFLHLPSSFAVRGSQFSH